jgi:hypothetical protein
MSDESRFLKTRSILRLFANGTSLNRFEAERHHDHCLHSTVSTLADWGIAIDRTWETVPCLNGERTTRCKRYWLRGSPDNLARAAEILGGGAAISRSAFNRALAACEHE